MFRSLPQDHLQGSSLVLSAYCVLASHFVICLCWYVVVCPLFVFVSPVLACVLSCRELNTSAHSRNGPGSLIATVNYKNLAILDFKLSLCCECCILSLV
jgi:hypothetical protein